MNKVFRLVGGVFSEVDGYWTDGGVIHLPMRGSEAALMAARIVVIETVERNLPFLRIDVEQFRDLLAESPGQWVSGAGGY